MKYVCEIHEKTTRNLTFILPYIQIFILPFPENICISFTFTSHILTLFIMRVGVDKKASYQFSPVTTTNVEISPRNFLTFSSNSFATLMQNFKALPSASPKLLNLNQDHPSRKGVFFGQILIKLKIYNII